MKKLLFFIVFLFGTLSFQAMANYDPGTGTYNYGCGPGVPPDVCSGGGGGSNTVPRVFGGVAVDPSTRTFGATWNYKNGDNAQSKAEQICAENSKSNRCIGYWSSYYYTAVAMSSDDVVTRFGSADSYDSAWNTALKACINAGGNDCEVMLMASSTSSPDEKHWGALAYDPETQNYGISWDAYTRREANEAALKECKNKSCLVLGFQAKYATFALASEERLYLGLSNKSMKDAEKDGIKGCKKDYKVKTCEIVLRGYAESKY